MEEITRQLRLLVEKKKTPSVQYLYFDRHEIIGSEQFGWADVTAQKKADEQTTYHGFSITKTFTALAILQLAEQGKIDLDAPVRQYLSDCVYPESVLVRHLLAHTGGIPNPMPLNWIHLVSEHAEFDRKRFFDSIFEKHAGLKFAPGKKRAYSNLGYILLGRVIEQTSGTVYDAYIRRNIVEPLQLSPTEIGFEIPDPGRHAKGYHPRYALSNLVLGFLMDARKYFEAPEGLWKPLRPFYVNGASYGGLIGTPTAFARYAQALLRQDELLSENFKKYLFTEQLTANNAKTGMAFAWFCGDMAGHKYYTHAGGGGGYYSEIRIYPGIGRGSAIFFNRTGMSDERILDSLDRWWIQNKSV